VGTLGGINLPSPPVIDASDGLLDVFVTSKRPHPLHTLGSYVLDVGDKAQAGIKHWKGREIMVRADPPQAVAVDGEPESGTTPVEIAVVPRAVQVVVPA
jgi:diacylglycerol kinase family enzyme